MVFGQLHLRPVLDAVLDANRAVRARLLLLDRVANIAIRVSQLPDSTLAATRIGEVRRVLCAAPGYLQRHGSPRNPAALQEQSCIMKRDAAETELWRFASAPGRSLVPVSIRPRLVVNSAATAVDSAIAGHGNTRVMSYQAASALAAGRLVVLLAKHEPPPLPVHLIMPSVRSKTSKQTAFVAFAAPLLRRAQREAAAEIGRTAGGA